MSFSQQAVGSGQIVRRNAERIQPGDEQGSGDAIVAEVLTTHASTLLSTARRHSLCADDAHDAFQRAMEILLRRADSLDPERAIGWVHTVVKHEAMAVRRARQKLVGDNEPLLGAVATSVDADPQERAVSLEEAARATEALRGLKSQEVKALWLKASGLSYAEIAERENWTYTKVNRCLTEGRKSFLARYAGIESGAECERWSGHLSALVDGEANAEQLAEVRPHLRNCGSCRATVRELHATGPAMKAVFPVPALALVGGGSGITGVLSRGWDTIVGFVSERSTAIAIKAQMAGDALGSAKVATVAATAVAAAGGGAAVVETATDASGSTADARPALVSPPPTPVDRPTRRAEHDRTAKTRSVKVRRSRDRRRSSEFVDTTPSATPDQVIAEFGPEAGSAPPAVNQPEPPANSGAEFQP